MKISDRSQKVSYYMMQILSLELESARGETSDLRISLRYRLGDTLLQAFPLSLSSFRVLPKIVKLVITHRRNLRNGPQAYYRPKAGQCLPSKVVECSQVSYFPALLNDKVEGNCWHTGDLALLLVRLDTSPPARLILKKVNEPIARRLARLKMQGCTIEVEFNGDDPFQLYASALISNIITGGDE